MFSRFRWTRGAFVKVLPVVVVALLLTLVPFWVGAGEETPSVEDVRVQVERMFASESAPALQIGADSATCEEGFQDR